MPGCYANIYKQLLVDNSNIETNSNENSIENIITQFGKPYSALYTEVSYNYIPNIYVCIYLHVCVYMHVSMYMYVCIYLYVFIYV